MALVLPDKLKGTGISRFFLRGREVEPHDPIIAYWCYWWVIDKMHKENLHLKDDECKTFMSNLVDKVLAMKSKYESQGAIKKDDPAAQVHIEKFGLDVLERADKVMRANKVTAKTAHTFLAAATFLDLLEIFGNSSQDKKRVFAKVHAKRILDELQNGRDPNLTNPPIEPVEPVQESVALDPNDPEVQKIIDPPHASVEEVPDEQDLIQQGQSTGQNVMWPPKPPGIAPQPAQTISPPAFPEQSATQKAADLGYFPDMSTPSQQDGQQPESVMPVRTIVDQQPPVAMSPPSQHFYTQPQQPPVAPVDLSQPTQQQPPTVPPPVPVSPPPTQSPQPPPMPISPPAMQPSQPPLPQTTQPSTSPPPTQFYTQQHQPQGPLAPISPPAAQWQHQPQQHPQPQQSYPPPQPQQPYSSPQPQQPYSPPQPQHPYQPPQPQPPVQSIPISAPRSQIQTYNTDDAAVADAQKHAKWAISALNFEDVKTAVHELQTALRALGA